MNWKVQFPSTVCVVCYSSPQCHLVRCDNLFKVSSSLFIIDYSLPEYILFMSNIFDPKNYLHYFPDLIYFYHTLNHRTLVSSLRHHGNAFCVMPCHLCYLSFFHVSPAPLKISLNITLFCNDGLNFNPFMTSLLIFPVLTSPFSLVPGFFSLSVNIHDGYCNE